ncbi:DUF2785 domain-containing protein [Lacticaseibacillus manihotivorans]|uniref:DUF2785 domain-containing protein n=2 Tax=Lacticaseibacillus manihotivorans TaxID=88233 RepID=A0A0R1Q8F9_9LACO|nr:DUF2785 domain-containing protein [Lacticaseibacillus manihotivorans]KRL37635.1 hypothetical protein FD01_GL002817 [Lacticaseibacillus manihotivorans DSM 13343 = JCM 12514]QFQ91960.1 DUF2785 domain-containing protein [Lacticaseibacillus manihotivorans]
MDELATTYHALQQLYDQLIAGKKFVSLPASIQKIMANITPVPATPVIVPSDDMAALQKIQAINARNKKQVQPTLSDDELSFLVDHLGSLQPAVRDKGVFFTLGDWLQGGGATPDQIQWLFKRLQAPDVLYAHILEPDNDAVFLRSFAVMILSAVVYADRNTYHVLSDQDYNDLVLPVATYIALEQDGRGYVENKGWAHTYTHIGNLLDELSDVSSLTRAQKVFLMMTALNGWQRMAHPLVYGEAMRFALYLTNLALMHQFYAQSLVMALTAWQKRLRHVQPQESQAFWNRWYNRSRLLEACIMRADMPQVVVDYLQKIIDAY